MDKFDWQIFLQALKTGSDDNDCSQAFGDCEMTKKIQFRRRRQSDILFSLG